MADVVGYSRLMERAETETYAAVTALRKSLLEPLFTAHNGRAVRVLGDGILVDFDSAVDAVQCAVAIQKSLAESNRAVAEEKRLVLRIGVNLGDVIVENSDIHGDGVNIAERLQSIAPPGGILISDHVYSHVHRQLPMDYEDIGEIHAKNISRPLRVHTVILNDSHRNWNAADARTRGMPEASSAWSERPRIAVLPFLNLSPDVTKDYFVDGFVDDLITDLSRFQTLSVIARTSSFVFRGPGHSLKQVGHELGAQYALEGSIRAAGDRIRITAQLIECEGGSHLWADRYDRALNEIFEVQDEVTSQIAGTLEHRLVQERLEAAKRLPPSNLKAYDYWLRANSLMEEWTAESDTAAIPLLETAIELDPKFARAYTSLAAVYSARNLLAPGSPTTPEDRAHGLELASKSVVLDPNDARNHTNLAWVYMLQHDFVRAEHQFNLAARLNPNDPNIMITRAIGIAFLGDAERGLEIARKACRVNPYHPDYYHGFIAACLFLAERYNDAIEAIHRAPTVWPLIWGWCAAAYGQLGLEQEAQRAAERFVNDVRRQWVGPSNAQVADYLDWFFAVNPIRKRADIERILLGFRRAKLPEPRSRMVRAD